MPVDDEKPPSPQPSPGLPGEGGKYKTANGSVTVVSRRQLEANPAWKSAFDRSRKDHRFYTIVEDTIRQEFEYGYFLIANEAGESEAIQPFFLLDQDLVAGGPLRVQKILAGIRKLWPRFLKARTLMVGCTAGEGHLDQADDAHGAIISQTLCDALLIHAKQVRVAMVVLKEFPAQYREALKCFVRAGYARVPSMPMTRLNIDYRDFEHYMSAALSKAMRKNLRRKFRDAGESAPIELTVMADVTPIVDELLPLYEQVYNRSALHFEKLTKDFLSRIGLEMPDKSRFFVWRQNGRVIAFSVLLLKDDCIYDEYIGLDYAVALDLHLYFYTFRDIVSWGIANKYRWYISTALNYDPKLHLKSQLLPLDLYVRHTSGLLNAGLRRMLPFLEPTRSEKILKQFPNYADLWGDS